MNDYRCNGCGAASKCSIAVQYGSVMCLVNQMQCKQTKAEQQKNANRVQYCPHCGKPLN